MEISFYPYDFEYKIKDKKVIFCMYSKLENGETICVQHLYQPYFIAQVQEADKRIVAEKLKQLEIENKKEPAKVVSWELVEKELLGKQQQFWKIYANYPQAVPLLSQELESWGIKCYEKDILFVHRYLRDNKITPLTMIRAEGQFLSSKELRVPVFLVELLLMVVLLVLEPYF